MCSPHLAQLVFGHHLLFYFWICYALSAKASLLGKATAGSRTLMPRPHSTFFGGERYSKYDNNDEDDMTNLSFFLQCAYVVQQRNKDMFGSQNLLTFFPERRQ